MKKFVLLLLMGILVLTGGDLSAEQANKNEFLVLCYHDIPKDVNLDEYGVDQASFVQQLEYLRTHGFNFVSMDDIIAANKGRKQLPEKAVLLTFDDGYLSFYEFVFPLLKLYKYPCVLAVETLWVDEPDSEIKVPLMNWGQIKEVVKSGLVEIADHTFSSHKGILYNPQGNSSWAAVSRIYDPKSKTYESEQKYRRRIHDDFELSKRILMEKAGVNPRVMVWPYGNYNQICIEEAKAQGYEAMFYLEDKLANTNNIYEMPRYVFINNPDMTEFIKNLKLNFKQNIKERVLHADLDLIYDPDPLKQEKNIDKFIERVYGMKVNTVYLQAFCDDKGDGNISSVYFPNRVLPMRADLFNRVVNQLSIRDIKVYAWMPMLSIVLQDTQEDASLKVMEAANSGAATDSSYKARLSPFNQKARDKLKMLYEDMAINSRIDGVIYLDDGYLNDFEDFTPVAMLEYRKICGGEFIPYDKLSPEKKNEWIKLKSAVLIRLTDELKKAVLYYRPQALFARTIYAEVLEDPENEEWYAQNFAECLKAYDYVVVMAYPLMEEVSNPVKWLRSLVKTAKNYPQGIEKTVFKVQSFDWEKESWIDTRTVIKWLRALLAEGALHVGYYPDNYLENEPDEAQIRFIMSTEDFPFKRKLTIRDLTLVQ